MIQQKYLLLFWCLKGEMEDEVILALCVCSEVRETVMRLLAEVDELEDESAEDCEGCE